MVELEKPRFDVAAFLASAGLGRRIVQFAPKEAFFSQGDPADSVFYLQKGRAKVTVVSLPGRKRPPRFSPQATLWEKKRSRRCLGYVWPRRLPLPPAPLSESVGER